MSNGNESNDYNNNNNNSHNSDSKAGNIQCSLMTFSAIIEN